MAAHHKLDRQPTATRELVNAAVAGLVARHDRLEPVQARQALERLLSSTSTEPVTDIAPFRVKLNYFVLPILEQAIEILGANEALSLVLGGDAGVLVFRTLCATLFARPETPLCSPDALASQISQFLPYLEEDRDHIVRTGLPRRCFRGSRYLYYLLSRLYDTRCTDSPCPQDELRDDWREDTPPYTWGRYVPSPLGVDSLDLPGAQFERCEKYEEASCLPGMDPEDVARIEAGRATLFELKADVLRLLPGALRRRDARGLWESCLGCLTSRLTAEDVEFYARMDAFYRGDDIRRCGSLDVGREVLPGGLTNLLAVVGHVEEELSVYTMGVMREVLACDPPPQEGGAGPFDGMDAGRAYFELIKRHGCEKANPTSAVALMR
jgi:hypothetical protein